MKISIIIPVYNSGKLILSSVNRLKTALFQSSMEWEILLRDDASADNSREILANVAKIPGCRVFYNERNLGLGGTLRKLFADARGENIIYCDCDLPFGTQVIDAVVKELRMNEVVVVSRYLGSGGGVPFFRRMASRMYYLLCRKLFNINIKDIGSGTVGLKKAVLEKITLETTGFDIHIELLSKLQKAGVKIREIPWLTEGNAQSSFSILKHGFSTLWKTFKLSRS